MTQENYLQDIQEIKQLMNRSSKFLSLSGLSGIFAGIYALAGAYWAYTIVLEHGDVVRERTTEQTHLLTQFMFIAGLVLLLSILTAFYFSYKKARKNGEKMWDVTAKNLLKSFLIPLLTGGTFALLLINRGIYGLVAPITLIFYGLALINASKYTYGTIFYLGISEVILGLLATAFYGNGLLFWSIGFGIFHIIYGTVMYFKFDRK